MRIIQHIDIPDNIAEYIEDRDGINLSININNADGNCGYAHMTWHSVVLSKLTRTCNRCGYDPLWKPNDDDSKCIRHTYYSWRDDEVFEWRPTGNNLSLEEAFDVWLQSQPTSWDQQVKPMTFGQIGWK